MVNELSDFDADCVPSVKIMPAGPALACGSGRQGKGMHFDIV
jgi:hypothetical protein